MSTHETHHLRRWEDELYSDREVADAIMDGMEEMVAIDDEVEAAIEEGLVEPATGYWDDYFDA